MPERSHKLRWEPQGAGAFYGYAGGLVVAMVVEIKVGGCAGRWAYSVDGVRTKWIAKGVGECKTAAGARRAADRAWAAWLERTGLVALGQDQGERVATDDLVDRFALAMKAKLRVSEAKYGWRNGWTNPHWRAACRSELVRHVGKGDPVDVASYAAFCWHHGWPTAAAPAARGAVAGREHAEAARVEA